MLFIEAERCMLFLQVERSLLLKHCVYVTCLGVAMASNRSWLVGGLLGLCLLFYLFILRNIHNEEPLVDNSEMNILRDRILLLESELKQEKEEMLAVEKDVKRVQEDTKRLIALRGNRVQMESMQLPPKPPHGPWSSPIPILVFVCNRADAARAHVTKLLSLRPSADMFPIVVSQDCDSEPVSKAMRQFGDKIIYIKHLSGEKAKIPVPKNHIHFTTYYRISRHYKLALTHVFDTLGYDSVVINEDDLDIAPDFFEYFSATRYLLEEDKSLYCVSAWNDNGKVFNIDGSASSTLYRSDFFPGLGWMMTSTLWKEFSPIWPLGFWDDWVREPEQRRNRSCIRPEHSRTSMTKAGKKGASEGLFFTKHLIKVQLSSHYVNFTSLNLDYLKRVEYDPSFQTSVYEDSPLITIDEVFTQQLRSGSVRVEYTNNRDYIKKADKLQIMHDFKAGVPRTAYYGVVSCVVNGLRVYLVPDRKVVHGYDKKWEVPLDMD